MPLENINTKYGRNILTAKSKSILTNLTKLNRQTKMTKSISHKMTISNLDCIILGWDEMSGGIVFRVCIRYLHNYVWLSGERKYTKGKKCKFAVHINFGEFPIAANRPAI